MSGKQFTQILYCVALTNLWWLWSISNKSLEDSAWGLLIVPCAVGTFFLIFFIGEFIYKHWEDKS